MKPLLLFALCLPCLLPAQVETRVHPDEPAEKMDVIAVPRNMAADSLIHHIYHYQLNSSKYGIGYHQQFGWLKLSDKFDTNEFYQWAKQYCIERVGEAYFYDNFRIDWHSFKDNAHSDIYEIRFYFFPPGFAFAHQRITFKKYVFLGIEEVETPANLPDCRNNPVNCAFPVNREAAKKIAFETVIKEPDWQLHIRELNDAYQWECTSATASGWAGDHFTIDARTGEASEPQRWHRID